MPKILKSVSAPFKTVQLLSKEELKMTELELIIKSIKSAGQGILQLKSNHTGKHSLATACETYSYELLKKILGQTDIPIVSRFDKPNFEQRARWNQFWILTPLLGKKNLRAGKDDYLVAITRIEDRRPVLAVIFAPERRELFLARENQAFKIEGIDFGAEVNIKQLCRKKNLIKKPIEGFFFNILKDKQPMNSKTEGFLKDFTANKSGSLKVIVDASPMKLLRIAEGKYDYFPHLSSVNEWEIAAFDALITASGNIVSQKGGILALEYNSKNLKFSAFIAKNNFEFDNMN